MLRLPCYALTDCIVPRHATVGELDKRENEKRRWQAFEESAGRIN